MGYRCKILYARSPISPIMTERMMVIIENAKDMTLDVHKLFTQSSTQMT